MIRDVRGAEEKLLNEHGDSDWESFRAQTIGDDEYLGLEREMCWFFFRHFPKLLLRLYDIAMRVSVIHMARMLEDNAARQEREKDLKRSLARMVRDLQKDIHQMLGTRKRGGSTGKLRPDLRKSLHLEYENIYPIAKTIKKQYENLRKTFNASRHRAGLDEWQEFWNESAGKLFPDIAPDFLTLFASADNPSASDVAYVWISQSTTLSQSYVRKKIKELRKAAKGTVETPE